MQQLRGNIQGIENPDSLDLEVQEEINSGTLVSISERLSDFLRSIDNSDEIYLIVNRRRIAIQYLVQLHSNGDTRVSISTVPKKSPLGIVITD